jgi:acyl-CoA reductase-like NAD-dependent aldehyde dehydrogenase
VTRLAVRKTYKLWIGGAFVRSESGRYDRATAPGERDERDVNIPRASRKDVRDAVSAARKAAAPWAARTAYNRGQILYRAAEALESSADRFAESVSRAEVEASVDVLLHYAGWTDKLHAVLGAVNPVAAPFLSFSLPEPTGVVGIVAVAILSEAQPLAGLDLAEVLGVSDVPAGVVNLLSGRRGELATALGAHRDLNAIVDAAGDSELSAELDRLAAETIKRVRHGVGATSYDAAVGDALERMEAVTELKTAWHPVGA